MANTVHMLYVFMSGGWDDGHMQLWSLRGPYITRRHMLRTSYVASFFSVGLSNVFVDATRAPCLSEY